MSLELITIKEVKEGLKGINRPDYAEWIWYAYPQGYLDLLAESLIKVKKIEKPYEVIAYYSKILTDDVLKSDRKVNYGDLARTASCNQQAKKLKEKITGEKLDIKPSDSTRRLGTLGHSAIPSLFCGELLKGKILEFDPKQKLKKVGKPVQASMFSNEYDYDRLSDLAHAPAIKKRRILLSKLVEKIENNWRFLVKEMQRANSLHQSKRFEALRKDLFFIYREHMKKVVSYENATYQDEYLYFLTFMSWATALIYYRHKGPEPMFREIPALKNSSDVTTGRIDALSVISIDGKEPTVKQLQKIRHMSNHDFSSVGHIIRALGKVFGTHVAFKISDWKFSVGDGLKGTRNTVNIIKKDDVTRAPLEDHVKQLKRYLATTVLSHSLASGFANLDNIEKLWETESFSLQGELVYFFADSLPIIHQVTLNHEEVKTVFKEQIVSSFFPGKRRASLRIVSNLAMKYAAQLIEGKEGQIKKDQKTGKQLVLDTATEEEETTFSFDHISVGSIIREYYEPIWKDDARTIEITEKRGSKEYLQMHIDKVGAAIDAGVIIADPGFTLKHGGAICCPYHGEATASCHLSYDLGRFTCFGCEISGTFAPSSIPDGVEIIFGSRTRWELESLVIPPRHREIMVAAQQILHGCFPGSKGEYYMYIERGLNPIGSHKILGIGYADERLIMGLLMKGFTYDELIYYGFLGVGRKVKTTSPIVGILQKTGLSIEQLLRPVPKTDNVYGLPYLAINECVTYPLELFKVINSFYARSVDPNCPKNLKHRKLRSKAHGIRHGGLNVTWATESKAEYIMVVEAPINMDTLIQTSTDVKALTALVGVRNPLLVEMLARHEGDIILGFDYDKRKWNEKLQKETGLTGQKNTVFFRDKLLEYGFKGNVWNFTGAFVKNNPGVYFNDFNQYWLDYGKRITVLDHLEKIPEKFDESLY